jgi:hypothetical protein
MNVARATGRMVSRLLALALFLLAGLGGGPRLEPAPAGCRAEAHACCCAPAGESSCACAGHQGPIAQLVAFVACGDPTEALAQNLSGTPGLPPAEGSLLAALLPVATLALRPATAAHPYVREPASPPPRSFFLSRRL